MTTYQIIDFALIFGIGFACGSIFQITRHLRWMNDVKQQLREIDARHKRMMDFVGEIQKLQGEIIDARHQQQSVATH